MKLKKHERLIYAGQTALRSPSGKLLPSVAQYMIVTEEQAKTKKTVEIKKDERLVLVGRILNEKKAAEERFAAMKAGYDVPKQVEKGIPLYIIVDEESVNKKGFTECEQSALAAIAEDLTPEFEKLLRQNALR